MFEFKKNLKLKDLNLKNFEFDLKKIKKKEIWKNFKTFNLNFLKNKRYEYVEILKFNTYFQNLIEKNFVKDKKIK